MIKIKWEIMPAPTGMYRCFHRRGWPFGLINGEVVFMFACEDDYVPRLVKTGNHKPISIIVMVDGKRLRFKDTSANLADAKDRAQSFVKTHPEKFEKKKV